MRFVIDGRTIQDHFPGVARYAFNLTRALARAAPQVHFDVLYDPAAPNSRYDLAELGHQSNVRLARAAARVFSLNEQWRIPRQVSRLAPDAILAPYYLRPYWMPRPVAFAALDLIPQRFPGYFRPHERLIFRLAMSLAIRRARVVLAISQATADDVRRSFGLPADRLAVTPLAADPAFRPQPPEQVAALRTRHPLPDRYGLYLASNKPHKNLVRLVEAVGSLLDAHPRLQLVVAGHWDERYAEARRQVEERGWHKAIHFLGPVAEPDLPALYSGAEWFIFPSLYEGFGLPVLEAMACGCPVLCSDLPVLREAAGEAAAYFDPYSVESMAQAIQRARAHPPRAERSLAQAAKFSWEQTAEQTLRALLRAAE